jgi:hypothetical protein
MFLPVILISLQTERQIKQASPYIVFFSIIKLTLIFKTNPFQEGKTVQMEWMG